MTKNTKRFISSVFSIALAAAAVALLVASFSLNVDIGASAACAVPNAAPRLMVNAAPAIAPTVIATVTVGNAPWGIGVNPATNRIYAANYYSNAISVIDGASNTVSATVTVGDYSDDIGVNPNTNRIYVSNFGLQPPPGGSGYGSTIWVIDGASNTVVATVPVEGYGPNALVVNPNTNRIYVASYFSDTVSVIDGVSNTVVATVAVGGQPEDVGVNPITNRIYVTNYFGESLSVIDGASNTVSATVTGVYNPRGVGVNPITNRIYVANSGLGTVSVIDGASNTVSTTVMVENDPRSIGVDPTANRIYVTNAPDGIISVIDGASDTVVATVTVGYGPGGVGVNPTTNRIYVANVGSGAVSVIGYPADLQLSMDYTLRLLSEITFTVLVGNSGPNRADGAVLSNTISANLMGATGNCIVSGGATCLVNGPEGMTIITFPVGSVVTYTLHGELANWSYFENTATVLSPVDLTDLNMSNNSVTVHGYVQFLIPILKNYFAP